MKHVSPITPCRTTLAACVLTLAGVFSFAADLAAQDRSVLPATAENPKTFRRVYVPLSELDRLLERNKQGVMLSEDEFGKLLKLAGSKASNPVAILVESSESDLEFAGNQVTIRTRLQIRQLSQQWQQLALPLPALPIESAMIGNQPARLGRIDGEVTLQHEEPGRFEVVVEQAGAVAFVGSDQVIGLTFRGNILGSLNVTVPDGKRLLADGLQVARLANGQARIPLGNRKSLSLQLTDDQKARSADALVFASSAIGISVAPGELSWQTKTQLSLFGQSLDRLQFSVPRTLEIAEVSSTGLESWELIELNDEPDRTGIVLIYRQPFDGTREITFRGISSVGVDEPWAVPNLELAGATSHNGQILIHYPRGTRLVQQAAEGVRRSEEGAVSGYVGVSPELHESALYYDIWQEDFQLDFVTQAKQREVHANVSNLLEVSDRGADLETLATLDCRYAPLFGIDLRLAAEWQVGGIFWNNQPIEWRVIPREAGIQNLQLEFPQPLVPGGSTQLRITAHLELEDWPLKTDDVEFDLPRVVFSDVNNIDGTCLLKADDRLDIVLSDSTGLVPTYLGLEGERSSFLYQGDDYSATLKVTRRPSRLVTRNLTVGRLDPDALRAQLEAMLEITGGGLTSLEVVLPASVNPSLRFQLRPDRGSTAVAITEQVAGEAASDLVTWTLKFDQRLHGAHILSVSTEVNRGDGEEWVIPEMIFPGATRQSGYVAVEADSEQQLQINAVDGSDVPLPIVDPLDLPPVRSSYVPQERIVAAFRHVTSTARVTLSEQRLQRVAVPTAVGDQMAMTSVVGRNGQILTRCTLSFRAVGAQGIRVELAEGAVLWASLLDQAPIEIRRQDETTFVVPLPPGASAESDRTLSLFYETRLTEQLRSRGRIQQQPPLLTIDSTGLEAAQPLEVLKATWEMKYPEEVQLIGSSGLFHPDGELPRVSLLGAMQQGFQLQEWEQLKPQLSFFGLSLLGLFFVAAVVKRWRWKGVALAVGLAVVGSFALMLNFSATGMFVADEAAPATMSGSESAMPSADYETMDFDDDTAGAMDGFRVESERDAAEEAPMQQPSDPFSNVQTDRTPQEPMNAPQAESSNPQQQQLAQQFDAGGERAAGLFDELAEGLNLGGARLSVRFDLPDPSSTLTQEFEYIGSAGLSGSTLDVEFEHEQSSLAMRGSIALGVVLILFLVLRNRSLVTRTTVAALGIFLPLALVTFMPVRFHLWLDGILLGSLGGVVLWFLDSCVLACGRCLSRMPWSRSISTGLLAVFTFLAADGDLPRVSADDQMPPAAAASDEDINTIFVPYDDNTNPLQSSRVFLPHQVFLELWKQAHPEEARVAEAPIPGLVSGALHVARLTGSGAEAAIQFQTRLIVHSFRSSPIDLELPLQPVALRSARLNGEPAAIRVQTLIPQPGKNQAKIAAVNRLHVVVPRAGSYVLDLEFAVPVRLQGPAGQFQVPLLPVASGKLSFELPASDLEVTVNNSRGTYRRRTEGESSWIDIPVDAGGQQSVAWTPRTSRDTMNVITHSTATTGVLIDDAGLHLRSLFQFQVRQGSWNSISFRLSSDARLQMIQGPDVGGWELAETDEERTLTVYLRRPIDDQTSIQVELFQAHQVASDEPSQVDIPTCEPLQITRESGQLAIFPGPQFRVRPESVRGLRQINADAFAVAEPLRLGSHPKAALAYQYQLRPFGIQLAIERRQAEGTAVVMHAANVERRRTVVTSRMQIRLNGTPRSRFNIRLPFDYTPLDVAAADLADWFVSESDVDTFVVLELQSARTGSVEIVMQGSVPKQPDDEFAEIDVPLLTGMESIQATLGIWFDPTYTSNLDEVEDWKPVPASQLPGEILQLQNRPPQFGFTTTALETFPISFSVRMRQPRLQGDIVSLINVFDTSIDYALNLKWTLQNAPSDTFVFSGPGWLENQLDLRAEGIRDIRTETLDDGRIRWTITTREPQTGQFYVLGTLALPPPAAETNIELPQLLLEQAAVDDPDQLQPLEALRAFAVVVNQSPNQLEMVDESVPVDRVEVSDLPVAVPRELSNQAAYMLRLRNPQQLPAWSVRRVVQSPPTPASVNFADLITVVAQDGSWRTQATYRTRNRLRQFLPLILPEKSRVLSAFVAGRPVRPVEQQLDVDGRNQTVFLVAMPTASAADTSFEIRIILAGQLSDQPDLSLWNVAGSDISLPVPSVVAFEQNRDYGVPVMQTRWNVYLPDNWDASIIDSADLTNMTPESTEEAEYLEDLALVKDAQEMLNVLSAGTSATQGYAAYDNLKMLQAQIEEKAQESSRQSGRVQEFNQNRELLERESRELKQKLDELSRRVIVDDQRKIVLTAPNASGFQTTDESQLESQLFGESRKRQIVVQQNDFLFGNNSLGVVESPQPSNGVLGGFRFELRPTDEIQVQDKAAKPASKQKESFKRESKVEQLERNLDQLRKQNDASNSARGLNRGEAGQSRSGVPELPMAPGGGFGGDGNGRPFVPRGAGREYLNDPRGGAIAPGSPVTGPGSPTSGLGSAAPQRGGRGFNTDISSGVRKSDGLDQSRQPPVVDFGRPQSDTAVNEFNLPAQVQLGDVLSVQIRQAQEFDRESGGQKAWTQEGGLSLAIDIPVGGKQLTLTKVGGNPRLGLTIRNDQLLTKSYGLGWSAVWLAVGITLILGVRRSGLRGLITVIPVALMLVGFLVFIGFGESGFGAGFVMFLSGALLAIARTLFVPPIVSAD